MRFYLRTSKNGEPRFSRVFKETVAALPRHDQQILVDYWESRTIVVDGVTERAPMLKLDRWFSVGFAIEGLPADAMVNLEGTLFTFDYGLLFAHEEVLTEVCAHEIAHAFFRSRGEGGSGRRVLRGIAETLFAIRALD